MRKVAISDPRHDLCKDQRGFTRECHILHKMMHCRYPWADSMYLLLLYHDDLSPRC